MNNEYKKFNETNLSNFQARYGEAIPDNDFPTNNFIENILKRQTVRKFKNKKLDPKLLEKLIAAAQSSPTSSMVQPWSVIAVESVEQRAKLFAGDNKLHMGILATDAIGNKASDPANFSAVMECSIFLIWLVDCSIVERIFSDPSLDDSHPELSNLRKQAKDAIKYTNYELRSIIDSVIAAQTLVLSAESLGLGTMYCGSIRTMDLKESFNIPEHAMPLFGICIGYPVDNLNYLGTVSKDPSKPLYIKPRLPQSVILHKEIYKEPDFEKVKRYNNLLKIFYDIEKLGYDWFDRVIRRTQLHRIINEKYRNLAEKYGFKFK